MQYIFLFFMSLILTYLFKEIAIKKSFLDMPNDRSSHSIPTPHGGGLAIVLTWLTGLSFMFVNDSIDSNLFYALASGGLISIVSFFDDLYDLNPKLRILVQIFVSSLGIYLIGGLSTLDFGLFIIENPIVTNIIAVIATVWFINLYNFLDGIDGYAGSEAIFLALAGFVLFSDEFFLVLIVAVAGFLVWNWHKAKIFMGDSGSTLLGYTIAIFSIYYQNDGSSILIWIILFGVFWFDATLTLLRRLARKEKLSQAHNKHAYQRLVQSGWKHDKVVVYAMGINLMLFLLAYLGKMYNALMFVFFVISIAVLFVIMYLIEQRKGF